MIASVQGRTGPPRFTVSAWLSDLPAKRLGGQEGREVDAGGNGASDEDMDAQVPVDVVPDDIGKAHLVPASDRRSGRAAVQDGQGTKLHGPQVDDGIGEGRGLTPLQDHRVLLVARSDLDG